MAEYRIQEETLTAIADLTREMAGISSPLTPSGIIYWLGRVMYIPQGWATSGFTLNDCFSSTVTGSLPAVVRSTARSGFTLNFKISATGTLQEE